MGMVRPCSFARIRQGPKVCLLGPRNRTSLVHEHLGYWPIIPRETPRRMLSVEDVLALIPVSRSTLFRMERSGQFPESHYVSPNRRLWYEDEVLAWQKTVPKNPRIARRRKRAETSPNVQTTPSPGALIYHQAK